MILARPVSEVIVIVLSRLPSFLPGGRIHAFATALHGQGSLNNDCVFHRRRYHHHYLGFDDKLANYNFKTTLEFQKTNPIISPLRQGICFPSKETTKLSFELIVGEHLVKSPYEVSLPLWIPCGDHPLELERYRED